MDLMCDNDVCPDEDYIKSSLRLLFPSDSLTVKRFERDDDTAQNMEDYQACDFGPHYMIKAKLEEPLTIEIMMDILDRLPGDIDMHPITRPCVLKSSAIGESKFISGIAIIAESHISMHYNTETHEMYMDVFSCKEIENIDDFDITINKFLDIKCTPILIKRGSRDKQRQNSQERVHNTHINWQKNIGY